MTTIPIFFTFDRNYTLAAKVSIYSLLYNSSEKYRYELYILHTSLTEKDCKGISKVIKPFNAGITFINVDHYEKNIENLQKKSHFSKEIFYKIIAAEIFPQYDRILCSDVDVVFTGDVSDAYFVYPDESFFYAGVGPINNDGRMHIYKNDFSEEEQDILEHEIGAGFLLLNLKEIRKYNKQEEMISFYTTNYHRLKLPEQDCMILTCWPHVRYIPTKYVVITSYYKLDISNYRFYKGTPEFNCSKEEAAAIFKDALKNPIQIHYAGPDKPWNSMFIDKQNIWLKAMIESGCLYEYIISQPKFLIKKIQKYSLKRFIYKLKNRKRTK